MASPTSVHDLIKNNLSIPTIPEVMMRINRLIEDPEVGTREIGEVVGQDAPLAAKVLRIANSAYYGLVGECVSTEHASTVLGVKVLKNLVAQVSVIRQFEHLAGTGFDIKALWEHSILTAKICSFTSSKARRTTVLSPEEFYVCGLLHDVGKVVMLDGLGVDYLKVVETSQKRDVPLHLLEKRDVGFTHNDVGAVVANRWSLPEDVITAIGHHHDSDEQLARKPVVALVAYADQLAHHVTDGNLVAASTVLEGRAAQSLGLDHGAIDAIVEYAVERSADGL